MKDINSINSVLLVDDEPNVLNALKRVLGSADLEITTALTGEAALEAMKTRQFAVIVTDMRMPGMDGTRFLSLATAQQPNARRIILTGYADLNQTIDSINFGKVHRYLTKPWDNDQLRQAIGEEVEIARKHNEEEAKRNQLEAESSALATKAAVTSHVLEHSAGLIREAKYQSALDIFNQLIQIRAPYLVKLNKAIASTCRTVGIELALDLPQLERLYTAAKLHQLGLLLLPQSISIRPLGELAPEEMAVYQTYPVLGERAIKGDSVDDEVANIIRHHQEWFNGKGFPDRLVSHYIPVESRIIAVVAAYEQVKSLYGQEAAGDFIQLHRNTRYDPNIVDTLLNLVDPT